ncbi:MAG: hypothetical protein ABSG76_05020 [Xanthobacteraceae bacterium]
MLVAGLAFVSALGGAGPAIAQTKAAVSVSAGTTLNTIPPAAFGVNTAVWDGDLLDAAVPGLLSKAGITALRYPGGSTSDDYNWQSNSIVPGQGGFANPKNGFDAFMGLVKSTGATPIITVNYGSNTAGNGGGTPSFAAAWVQYANVTKGYGVKYWEVGNEVYGNGEYGAHWETDLHSALDPTTYGTNVAQFAAAMKAVDPTIKVGAVLTAPGNWPDGQSPNWNTNVLSQCGTAIDFVIVHWYPQNPGSESDSGLLAAPQSGVGGSQGIAAMMSAVKSLIAQHAGANAPNVQILVTETNSVSSNPGKQTVSIVNAMFIADDVVTWLENGAASVDVWTLHNGSTGGNTSSSLFGTAAFGDYGILSNATSGEPAADTPFPSYYGIQMLSVLGRPGDALVSAASSNNLLTAHAVQQSNGNLALLLINKDPNNTVSATVSVSGYTPSGSGTVSTYGKSSSAITSTAVSGLGSSFTVAAAPYSLTTIVLAGRPSGTTIPPGYTLAASPTSLSVAQAASGKSTIAVMPSGGFTGSVAFAASGVPTGVTASFNPASASNSTTLTLGASSSAAAGTSVVTINATSGALSASTTLALTVSATAGGTSGGGTAGGGPATFTGKASANGAWFDEDDVVLSSTTAITALTLTISVPATNVTYGGLYNTIGSQIVESHASGTNIVYTFALTSGQTIGPGTFTFAAQMGGNGTTHNVAGDTWSVTYSSGGATFTQSGVI